MKKFFVFLVLLMLLGFAYSEEPQIGSAKNIGDTQVTLLSNTSQCLVDCEAWLLWDLSASTSDILTPTEAGSQFNLELTKQTSRMRGLESFGTEVWEQKAWTVTDYCEELVDTGKKDVNGTAIMETILKECGSHIEQAWIKTADSIYGFGFKKGLIYKIRFWGKKKASLEKNNIDWIPTILGTKIGEWAWWDATWNYRQEITLATSTYLTANVTNDHIIPIKIDKTQTTFWQKVAAHGEDVRFVASDDLTQYSFYFEQFDYADKNAVAWVKIPDTFPFASNLKFWIYYGNPSATDGQDYVNPMPLIYEAVYDFNESAGTTAYNKQTKNVYNITHVNSPTLAVNVGIDGSIKYKPTDEETSSQASLGDTDLNGFSLSFWVQFDRGWSAGISSDQEIINKTNAGGRAFVFRMEQVAGNLLWRVQTDTPATYALQTDKVSWDANTWYNIVGTYSNTDDNLAVFINGESQAMAADGEVTKGTLGDFWIASQSGASFLNGMLDQLEYFPNTVLNFNEARLIYHSQNFNMQSFGAAETYATASLIDVNITKVDGSYFADGMKFNYASDGNLTLTVSVQNSDNNRIRLDLNYSTSASAGTGIVLVKDLNLSSGECASLDWYATPVECTWDWNISRSLVNDGIYYILADVNSINGSDSNHSNFAITIANDFNILIKVPIDEQTLLPIDTNTYSWNVQIIDESGVHFYYNQIDQNNFLTIKSSSQVIVRIDTNTTDYYMRQYFLLTSGSDANYVLQPYLVKKATAGGTGIQSVLFTRTLNNTAIPNISIKSYKDLPAGKTLIEQITTDVAGSATFSFIQSDTYFLTFTSGTEVLGSDLELRPIYTSYQFYFGNPVFNVPDTNAVILDVNFFPAKPYIDSNNTIDLNVSIKVIHGTIIDLNIIVYTDNNVLYSQVVFTDGFYDLPPISVVGVKNNKIKFSVILHAVGSDILIEKSTNYTINLSFIQAEITRIIDTIPLTITYGGINPDGSDRKEVSTLLSVLITIFLCGAIVKKGYADTGGVAIFALLILGIFAWMQWVFLPIFFLACLVCFGLIIYTRSW